MFTDNTVILYYVSVSFSSKYHSKNHNPRDLWSFLNHLLFVGPRALCF